MIKAEIIKDSINISNNKRITTWILTYPRMIHSEVLTHRMLSKNSASSRAIPIKKMLKDIWNNPAEPVFWGLNQSGMQAAIEATGLRLKCAKFGWKLASKIAVITAWCLSKTGLHKQIVNRIVEPFAHMTVIMTATEMNNFFALRAHKDAQPEFQALAFKMKDLYYSSIPEILKLGEWHIPFGDKMPQGTSNEDKLKIATARCARVSYLSFDGKMDIQKDFEIYNKLAGSVPKHLSPFEHCAIADEIGSGNFKGWKQYRNMIPNESGE